MVHGVVYGGEVVSDDALLDWHTGIAPDRVALICSAYAFPESITETREGKIMDKFFPAGRWNRQPTNGRPAPTTRHSSSYSRWLR